MLCTIGKFGKSTLQIDDFFILLLYFDAVVNNKFLTFKSENKILTLMIDFLMFGLKVFS